MKKFLIIAVVLSLASVANAGIVLSVDADTTVSSKVMGISDTIDVGIYVEGSDTPTINSATGMATDGSTILAGGNLKIAVRGAAGGTVDVSGVTYPGEHGSVENVMNTIQFSTSSGDFSLGLAYWEVKYTVYDSSSSHMSISGGGIYSNVIGNTQMQDDLVFTCSATAGPYYIDLIAASDIIYFDWAISYDLFAGYTCEVDNIYTLYSQNDVIDTITIVPEPMTVLLLGLGGLFLRRRK